MPTVITCGPGGSTTQEVFDAVNEANASAETLSNAANEASLSASTAVTAANEADLDRQAAEAAATTATSAKDAIEAYVIPTDATYNPQLIDSKINALAPYSGYTQVSKKLDNFVFKTDANFTYSVADKNRYVKFGDTVVDTYGPELVTNGDFSDGITGWSGTAVFSVDNGILFVTSSSDGQLVEQTITAEIGKTYLITYDMRLATATGGAVIISGGNYPTLTGNNGLNSFISTATSTAFKIRARVSGVGVVYFDNISVREIQTADFSNDIPDVAEVITDGSNTTSVSVNAGDYVVDGSELVSFNSSAVLGVNTKTSDSTEYITVSAPVVAGNKYSFKSSFNNIDATSVLINIRSNLTGSWVTLVSIPESSSGDIFTFIADGTGNLSIQYTVTGLTGTTFNIDSASAKRVSNTFRAIQIAPIGTALTDTAYFEDRTQIGVTNQVLSYHAYNTLTKAYEGIKTEVLFSDVSKEDLLNNDTWMSANGFSKVSKHLYSKGVYYVLPIGIWQSLNKGAYNPMLNPFGTAYSTDGITLTSRTFWYSISTVNNNLSESFINACTAGNGNGTVLSDGVSRPDSKYYDIVYTDQFIDVRQYAKIATPYEIELIRKDKEENGVEEAVFTDKGVQESGNSTDPSAPLFYPFNTFPQHTSVLFKVGQKVAMYSATASKWKIYEITSVPTSINNPVYGRVLYGDSWERVNGQEVVWFGSKPILSSGTKLSIDLIGNPQFYPQVLKDRLASGVGVVGVNPLLVGQDGTDYVTPIATQTYILSDKSTVCNQELYMITDAWAGYGSDRINKITNALENVSGTYTLRLISCTSKNKPYIQTTPKPVVEVEPKVIATNSHSIYKGALVGNQVSGRIATGNGANGYESKMLDNGEIGEFDELILQLGGTIDLFTGRRFYVATSEFNIPKKGDIVEYIGTGTYLNLLVLAEGLDYINAPLSYKLVGFVTTPQHSTIALDNSTSSASKYFYTLAEDADNTYAQVFGEEITYDGVSDWGDTDFSQLTNGTIPDVNGGSDVRTFCGLIPLNIGVK